MMRAAIYCRVSTKEQAKNLSLATQQRACVVYCRQHCIEVDKVWVEEGESAKTADRPEFQKLLSYCRENKGRIHCVVVYKIDRFARDKYDHYAVRLLLNKYGITLRSATEPIDDSSTGKLMEGILAACAQFDNDVRGERTVAGMRASLEKGRWTFQAPLGYLKPPKETGTASLVSDPERGPLVRQAFEIYAKGGYSKKQVLERVTSLGLRTCRGKKLTSQTFGTMLRNPIYAGWQVVKEWGIRQRGDFEALVSEETFNRVRVLLTGKRLLATPHFRNHPDFPLRRNVRCAKCAKPLTGSWSKGRSDRYAYYRCPNSLCKAVNVRKEVLESKFLDLLEQLQPNPEYMGLFKEIVLDVWRNRQVEVRKIRTKLEDRTEELQERKNRLFEAFVYEKTINQETYQEQLDRLNEQITLVQTELHDAELDVLDVEGVLGFAEHLLTNAARLWSEFRLDQKQRFQHVLFPKGLSFDGEAFGTGETCSFFSYLRELQPVQERLATPAGFEPALPP